MDYGVFLMTRIRERWSATGHAHQAVIEGRGARMIASAALITVSVFCAFVINGDPNVKQFGLGLAVAVAVAVGVVRCLVVPAAMSLLSLAAWWLPRWPAPGVPNLSVEGERWFERHDEKPAIGAPVWSLERAE
jgi:putative drug exporter of the RND superfamily